MEQLTLAIKFTTTIENRDTFKDILTNLFETISHEKNFVNAIIHQGIQNTNEFFVYENWNDNIQDFLAVQMKKDFVVQFEQSLIELDVKREPAAYTPFAHFGTPELSK